MPAVRGASASLADRVGAAAGVRPWVQPVVVLWTRFPQRVVEDSGVQFVHGKALVEWLTSGPPRLSVHQVERLRSAIEALASASPRGAGTAVSIARSRQQPNS